MKVRALMPPEVVASYESIVQAMKNAGGTRRAGTQKKNERSDCTLEYLTQLRKFMSTSKVYIISLIYNQLNN